MRMPFIIMAKNSASKAIAPELRVIDLGTHPLENFPLAESSNACPFYL